jgi:hypothetical protein
MAENLRHIDLYYDNADSHGTALALILALRPEWQPTKETVEFVRFKDGITNTVRARRADILILNFIPREALVLTLYSMTVVQGRKQAPWAVRVRYRPGSRFTACLWSRDASSDR